MPFCGHEVKGREMFQGSSQASLPARVEELDTPAVLIERSVLHANVSRMQRLANKHGLKLRPHIKTHKSVMLAQMQLEAGACGIAVAKLAEAEVFAAAGFRDIQIANQIVGKQKIARLAALAQNVDISCAVDSETNVMEIAQYFASQGLVAELFIEIDTGLHRCGVDTVAEAQKLAALIAGSPSVRLRGLLTHAGHAYAAASPAELGRIALQEGEETVAIAQQLRREGFEINVVSVGSTPTSSGVAQVAGVSELRVGNYIFNDMIQVALGAATIEQCALSVLSTVISVHPNRVVIDAGSKVLSSDAGAHGSQSVSGFGQPIGSEGFVVRLSEEHGVIQPGADDLYNVGQRVRVIPNHACPVMNLVRGAFLVDGELVLREIGIEARACSL